VLRISDFTGQEKFALLGYSSTLRSNHQGRPFILFGFTFPLNSRFAVWELELRGARLLKFLNKGKGGIPFKKGEIPP